MRVGILTDVQGQPEGKIVEEDGGRLVGEGTGERLIEKAPGKTFDDWLRTIHHSTYLRMIEGSPDQG